MRKFSFDTYQKLLAFKAIVSDKSNAPGIRRLAMRDFDRLMKSMRRKP